MRGEAMRTTQRDRMLDRLKPGQWVASESFSKDGIRDDRKRFSELNADYPGRFVSRVRRRKIGKPDEYRMMDRRDTQYDDARLTNIRGQVEAAELSGEGTHTFYAHWLDVPFAIKSYTYGELILTNNGFIAQSVFNAYTDPWKGKGVIEHEQT